MEHDRLLEPVEAEVSFFETVEQVRDVSVLIVRQGSFLL